MTRVSTLVLAANLTQAAGEIMQHFSKKRFIRVRQAFEDLLLDCARVKLQIACPHSDSTGLAMTIAVNSRRGNRCKVASLVELSALPHDQKDMLVRRVAPPLWYAGFRRRQAGSIHEELILFHLRT